MICDAGDTVLVPFPFVDIEISKLRPALVLSPAAINKTAAATLVAMITSAKFSRWPTDIVVQDWRTAGLRAPSVFRSKLFTLDNRLIGRRLGALSEADSARVREMLRTLIAV